MLKRHMANLFAVAAALQSVPAAKSAKMPSNDGPGPQITHHESGYPLPEEVSLACYPTPLRVDPQAYEARCVATKGPCFSIVGASLQGTDISPWLEPLDMTYEMLLSDESAQDFTVRNASDAFEIGWLNYDYLRFRYTNFDPVSRCYDVNLGRRGDSRYRMSIGEDADTRDLDTLHGEETSTRFCSEKLVINIREL